MAFGDEDLTGLRAQLIGAGYDPTGERYLGLGAAPPASGSSRQLTGDRAPSHGPVLGSSEPAPRASAVERQPLDEPRQRDEFLAMLGHELRNPLAPLMHAVDVLVAHASAQDSEDLRRARATIARQVEHLSRLTDVLLGSETRAATPGSETTAALALITRVVELQGGRIASQGGGDGGETDLRIWLPATPPEPQPASSSPPVTTEAHARRVLVVDDNEDAAEMLALVLRKRGYTVVLAFDGEEALTMAQTHQPEVVLLDIGLPGIDGYEVARRLRAMPTAERPVLVAVTGYGQPADRQRSREAGFDHHLVKPVAMEKLLPLLS